MILYATPGLALTDVLQGLSRVFGNQRQALRNQGFDEVKVLCIEADLNSLRSNEVLMTELRRRFARGMNAKQAQTNLPADADIMYQQQRSVGAKRAAISPPAYVSFRPAAGQRHSPDSGDRLRRAVRRAEANRALPIIPPSLRQRAVEARERMDEEGGQLGPDTIAPVTEEERAFRTTSNLIRRFLDQNNASISEVRCVQGCSSQSVMARLKPRDTVPSLTTSRAVVPFRVGHSSVT
jgi:hypothetical protein